MYPAGVHRALIDPWICSANKAIEIKLVNTEFELDAPLPTIPAKLLNNPPGSGNVSPSKKTVTPSNPSTPQQNKGKGKGKTDTPAAKQLSPGTANTSPSSQPHVDKIFINTGTTFAPLYTYAMFGEKEKILGYKGLKIKLYYTAGSLQTYLGISYEAKLKDNEIKDVKADDIVKMMSEKIKHGMFYFICVCTQID